MKRLICRSCVSAALAWSTWGHAQIAQPSLAKGAVSGRVEPLEVRLDRKKVVTVGGKEALVGADVAKPGDTLLEVASYTNKSNKSLVGFQATLPIPQNTEMVAGSAQPSNALASTDGKSFAPLPLMRRVKTANGMEKEEMVPLAEYRYLRWSSGEMPAEKTLSFSARFRLSEGY
jgi:hypothetical protein